MDGLESMLSPSKGTQKRDLVQHQMHTGTALKNEQLRDRDEDPIRVEEKVAWMSNKGQQRLSDGASTVGESLAGMQLPFFACSSHHDSPDLVSSCQHSVSSHSMLLSSHSMLLFLDCPPRCHGAFCHSAIDCVARVSAIISHSCIKLKQLIVPKRSVPHRGDITLYEGVAQDNMRPRHCHPEAHGLPIRHWNS
jgi:hypothetical protein